MKSLGAILTFFITSWFVYGQEYTRHDTLRGTLSPLRSCFDVAYYGLDLTIDIDNQSIFGYCAIHFFVVEDFNKIQLDLFDNMIIDYVEHMGEHLHYTREGNAFLIDFPYVLRKGSGGSIRVAYHGKPKVARSPPWDGGFVWKEDKNGNPWVGVACEGTGASLWWPNKDHPSDEPESMTINLTIPPGQVAVANGHLAGEIALQEVIDMDQTRYDWSVKYPINNYNVTLYIGDYDLLFDDYISKKDTLRLSYYVLKDNLDKAKRHFQQVKPMLSCFEQYFGPYPFWKDGYKLVEAPYWGMEHQSAIAYGNDYTNNKWGFDFIIIHESAHEWWGNSISCGDFAELWIHEGFATYAEALYVECMQGYDQSLEYLQEKRMRITNNKPLIGDYGVNYNHTDNDIYYKGAWLLHTLRHVINNDSLWFKILYRFATENARTIVTTQQFIDLVEEMTGKEWDYFFEQYLHHADLPEFVYKIRGNTINIKWNTDVKDFKMPIKVKVSEDKYVWLHPTTDDRWVDVLGLKKKYFRVVENLFLIEVREE